MDTVKIFGLCFIFCVMVGYVSSDITQDKKECQSQLLGLSTCLVFVSGEAKLPTPACCSELRQDLKKTKLCLCLLVKDRNDLNLGYKINATLALSLPYICHAPANVSQCPELLHLAPNSPDAQVFEEFSSSSVSSNNTKIGELNASSSTSLIRKRWINLLQERAGVSLWLLIMALINIL